MSSTLNTSCNTTNDDDDVFIDPEDSALVAAAKRDFKRHKPFVYTFTERDVALYNLSIGAKATDLRWIFDGDEEFEALPTLGTVPHIPGSRSFESFYLPNFNPVSLVTFRLSGPNEF